MTGINKKCHLLAGASNLAKHLGQQMLFVGGAYFLSGQRPLSMGCPQTQQQPPPPDELAEDA